MLPAVITRNLTISGDVAREIYLLLMINHTQGRSIDDPDLTRAWVRAGPRATTEAARVWQRIGGVGRFLDRDVTHAFFAVAAWCSSWWMMMSRWCSTARAWRICIIGRASGP
jgi:hypothetical protein